MCAGGPDTSCYMLVCASVHASSLSARPQAVIAINATWLHSPQQLTACIDTIKLPTVLLLSVSPITAATLS